MPDFRQLQEACASASKKPEMPLDSTRPVWVFGAGGFGRDVSTALRRKGFDVAGFVETTPRVSECLGLPVRSWTEMMGIYNREFDTCTRSPVFGSKSMRSVKSLVFFALQQCRATAYAGPISKTESDRRHDR
jgi:hypothetical protein